MVDIKTHRIIDMINSREYEPVKEWLKTYPNIRIVSRDGSITYHNAITAAHPDAIQISDRFHLLKNLTSYATDYLKKELKSHMQISIPQIIDSSIDDLIILTQAEENRKLTLKEKYEQIENLISLGFNKTMICQSLNMDIRVYDKLMTMIPSERDTLFQTKMMTVHEEKVRLKINKVNEVRELKNIGCSNREISRRTGLNTTTIRSYLDENFNMLTQVPGYLQPSQMEPIMKYFGDNIYPSTKWEDYQKNFKSEIPAAVQQQPASASPH